MRHVSVRPLALVLLLLALNGGLAACGGRDRAADRIAEDTEAAQASTRLSFDNITLEQADENGKTVWKIQATRADYSPDDEKAIVTNPNGELFQDGEAIYKVVAKTGEVYQNGEKIFLKGGVVATDSRNGAVLKGEELEWRPGEGIMLVKDGIRGTHPQLNASAESAKVFTRDRRMELSGKVAATTQDPNLRLIAERLIWYLDEERVESPQPVTVERYVENQIVDRASGNKAKVDLEAKTVNLQENATLTLLDPPLQVTSDDLLWNVEKETIAANQPVRVVHQAEQIVVTANQGRMDMKRQVVSLSENVQAVGQQNETALNANQLTWNIPTQEVQANGNVTYRQANPDLVLQGERAVGKLERQTIVVSGGQTSQQVVTEIIPE